jgi:hypothetical protein
MLPVGEYTFLHRLDQEVTHLIDANEQVIGTYSVALYEKYLDAQVNVFDPLDAKNATWVKPGKSFWASAVDIFTRMIYAALS